MSGKINSRALKWITFAVCAVFIVMWIVSLCVYGVLYLLFLPVMAIPVTCIALLAAWWFSRCRSRVSSIAMSVVSGLYVLHTTGIIIYYISHSMKTLSYTESFDYDAMFPGSVVLQVIMAALGLAVLVMIVLCELDTVRGYKDGTRLRRSLPVHFNIINVIWIILGVFCAAVFGINSPGIYFGLFGYDAYVLFIPILTMAASVCIMLWMSGFASYTWYIVSSVVMYIMAADLCMLVVYEAFTKVAWYTVLSVFCYIAWIVLLCVMTARYIRQYKRNGAQKDLAASSGTSGGESGASGRASGASGIASGRASGASGIASGRASGASGIASGRASGASGIASGRASGESGIASGSNVSGIEITN